MTLGVWRETRPTFVSGNAAFPDHARAHIMGRQSRNLGRGGLFGHGRLSAQLN
jgi:hypothetical protein